jgi:hypothetical protein
MMETVYKTKVPQTTDWRDQFFELSLGEQTVDGQHGYFVRETQCWWDASAQRIVRVQYTLSPREGFMTIEEARVCYESRKLNRARRGFIHSFTPRYDATKKNRYLLVEVPEEAKKEELKSEDPQS